jgi:predicted ATPase/DNA-binding CsgD family transcriptional regulator
MKDRSLSDGEMYADDLTWREQDILVLLADRLTNREIANRLHLAESTVKDYVGKILSKLYVSNRREAVERAKALGLLGPDRVTSRRQATNLPAEPTPFVGRQDELAAIKQHMTETRLLTLTGPGGIGKTRLALKASAGSMDDFQDGCFFVSLAPIHSVESIVQTIAEAVKYPLATHEAPQHQLLRYLREKQLLLVMDNFEHLLDGAGIISEVIKAAPRVKILATSRERLNLQSETLLPVGGMAFPGPADSIAPPTYDAITLFVQRANKVRPGFNPSPQEMSQIATICQLVGGMPLAIELAAAWLQILSVQEIAEELEKGLDILTTEVRDAPERHRSIRDVFDHSWSLLDQAEREIFKVLSVFRGGFTRAAAQQVSDASLQKLTGLVNKSFLNHEPDTGRLEIHELLRQYAQEKLEAKPEARINAQGAHAAYFAAFMEDRWPDLRGGRQMEALVEIESDIENVRAAWRYCLDRVDTPKLWKFVYGLWNVYFIRGWNLAGMELFAEATRVLGGRGDDETAALRALTMALQGYFLTWLGLPMDGYNLAKDSVAILEQYNHPEALGLAYESSGVSAYFLNRVADLDLASSKMEEIATELDDKRLLTVSLYSASMTALVRGDFDEAGRLAESALILNEEIGNVIGLTFPLIALGHVAFARGEYEDAREYLMRCLKNSEAISFHWANANACKYLSKVALSMGSLDESEKYLVQSLKVTKQIGFVRDIINLLYDFACLRVAQADVEQAVTLLMIVFQHPASQQYRWLEGRIRDSARGLLDRLERELPQGAYAAAAERSQELELDEIVADLVCGYR